nr:HutD family protein [uncultured Sphingomonas sp.]
MRSPIHLPAAVRKAQPWQNGGGRTTTIMQVPSDASLDTLDWRISIADIDSPGPFSLFPGMTRHLMVLKGGVQLIGENADATLGIAEGAFRFSGDRRIYATPLVKGTRVLNVIVRRGRFDGSLRRTTFGSEQRGDNIAVYVADKAAVVTIAGWDYHLSGEDGLMLTGPGEVLVSSGLIAVDISCR